MHTGYLAALTIHQVSKGTSIVDGKVFKQITIFITMPYLKIVVWAFNHCLKGI